MKDINGVSVRLGDIVIAADSNEFFVERREVDYRSPSDFCETWYVYPVDYFGYAISLDDIGPFTIKDVVLREKQLELNFSGAL